MKILRNNIFIASRFEKFSLSHNFDRVNNLLMMQQWDFNIFSLIIIEIIEDEALEVVSIWKSDNLTTQARKIDVQVQGRFSMLMDYELKGRTERHGISTQSAFTRIHFWDAGCTHTHAFRTFTRTYWLNLCFLRDNQPLFCFVPALSLCTLSHCRVSVFLRITAHSQNCKKSPPNAAFIKILVRVDRKCS